LSDQIFIVMEFDDRDELVVTLEEYSALPMSAKAWGRVRFVVGEESLLRGLGVID